MESAPWLTSAGVTGPVIGGATAALGALEAPGVSAAGIALAGVGDAGAAAVSVFFWQAAKAPSKTARARSRFANRRTEMFSMVKLGGSNLCGSLAQVSAPAPRAK